MKKFLVIAIIGLLGFNAFIGYKIFGSDQQFGQAIPTVVALFETSLQSSVTSSATSMTLNSGTDKQGNSLSGTYGFIIDEGTSSEEFIVCSASSTALTSCTRGISVTDGKTSVAALQKSHRRGATIKITNYPQLAILSRILNGQENAPNKLYYPAGTSLTTASSSVLVDKNYVDSGILAGCTDATLVAKGCSELATVAEINAGTGLGGSLARLFVNPSYLASSNYATYLPTANQKTALAGPTSFGPNGSNYFLTNTGWVTASRINEGAASGSGDFLVRNGSAFARLASAGNNNYTLISSSSFAQGVTWRPIVRWEWMGQVATGSTVADGATTYITVPTGALAAIVQVKGSNTSDQYDLISEFTIFPTGKTSGTATSVDTLATETSTVQATWSGNQINISVSGPATQKACYGTSSCKADFFK